MKTIPDLPKRLLVQMEREVDAYFRDKHARGIFDEGDPNHPKYNNGINYVTGKPATLFGYDTDEFMGRQHQRAEPQPGH